MAERFRAVFARTARREARTSGKGSYKPRNTEDVAQRLSRLLRARGVSGRVSNVHRMGGGASKEQFLFDVVESSRDTVQRFVLRIDPLEGIIETCRAREGQLLEAISGAVPVPKVALVDADGQEMGQPALIADFVSGDTKPRDAKAGPSGVGIIIGELQLF